MITFRVVKEACGWAIRVDERMTAPFWSRDLAISQANALAYAIRCHGACTEVVIEALGLAPEAPADRFRVSRSSRLAVLRRRWTG
jgi:hypothetical protein